MTVTGVDDALVDGRHRLHDRDGGGREHATPNYNARNAADVAGDQHRQRRGGDHGHADRGPLTTTEAGGTATFTVVLNTQPTADVTIGAELERHDRRHGRPASLTFTTGNWNVAQTVTVTGVDDALVDGTSPTRS